MARIRHAARQQWRLEQARVVVAHDLGGGHRGQVRGPLVLAARAERLAEAEQDERAAQ
jgi:hypothetical protein